MPPPGIYAGAQVCTTTTLMPLASPGLKSPRKGLDKSLDTLNTSELRHLFYYAQHTTTDSGITMLHGSPGSQLLKSYFQKCFPSLPPSQWGKGINLNTDQEGEKKGFNPVPPSREPGVYHSDSVQTPQPVYGGREHCPLEPPHRILGGRRQRGLQVGVQCPVLPTLGTQAYSPMKRRSHSQVVVINNRTSKALFSFSLHPN